MHKSYIIKVPIQSVSDLITNSSSEVFCRISSDNLDEVWELLYPLFRTDSYYDEEYPTMAMRKLEDEKDNLSVEDIKKLPYKWIEIVMPYCMSESKDFYKAGLEALLGNNFENCKIIYEDEEC